MLKEEKNLKNSQRDIIKDTSYMPAPYQAVGFGSGSYTKTNKLITALYMVTDIIDQDEPLRNKLRTLGTEIISDTSMSKMPFDISNKINQIMSFLDIASAVNIISEMNCSILKKEFLELNQSVKESIGEVKTINRQMDLSEFFTEEMSAVPYVDRAPKGHPIGHCVSTRIGVQKGSTLLKALSDNINTEARSNGLQNFDILKKQRRDDIINIIKTIGGNATIKDIKDRAKSFGGSLLSCGEKTLQRELVSMVKDGVLNREGSKRWSKYFLKN
ncbi:MAG: hypothetical protein AAB623_00430 [Patescibacteria group bacterium]